MPVPKMLTGILFIFTNESRLAANEEKKKDIMKRLLVQKTVFAVSYIVLALLFEIITFLAMGLGRAVPRYFGLDIAIICIIAFLIFIIPSRIAQLIVIGAILTLQIILSIANEALYSMSGTVFSFSMLNLVNEVTGVMDASFLNWWLIVAFVLIFGGSLAGLIVFALRYPVPKGLYSRNAICIMIVAFILANCCAGILYMVTIESFSAFEKDETYDRLSIFYDEEELYTEQFFTVKAFYEFGTFGYFMVNIYNSMSGNTYVDEVNVSDIDSYFAEGQMSESVYGDNIYTGAIDGKNIVLITIESGEWYAINKEYTPTLYAMAEGGIAAIDYHARDKTNCSEALSIMGSYPSVTALEPEGVSGNAMPYTLANILGKDGYTSNYFHINDGGYYGRDEVFESLYGFDNTHFLEDMPLLDGYENKEGFYDFDKDSDVFKYYLPEFTCSEDDGPFFTQMMTLISHGRYTDLLDYGNYPFETTPEAVGEVSSGEMDEEETAEFSLKCQVKGLEDYYGLIDRFPSTFVEGTGGINESYLEEQGKYSEMFLRYKRYQAGIMDLDYGINMLVTDLAASGELKDTFFMFYADHSAYYDQMNYIMKGIDNKQFYNTDLYAVPCFMWYGGSMDLKAEALDIEGYSAVDYVSPGDGVLRSGKITKFCNTYDILPTILHLCGFSYNRNLYHGTSMFSEEETVFVSHESGIFIDDIYFSTIHLYVKNGREWDIYDFDETYRDEGFGRREMRFLYSAVDYYDKQTILDAVLLNDYFADVDFYGGDVTYVQKVN